MVEFAIIFKCDWILVYTTEYHQCEISGMSRCSKTTHDIGGIPSPRKTMFFGMPEIYDFPAHQKSLYAELAQIMPPSMMGGF